MLKVEPKSITYKRIINAYCLNLSIPEMAKTLGHSEDFVVKFLHEYNLPENNKVETIEKLRPNRMPTPTPTPNKTSSIQIRIEKTDPKNLKITYNDLSLINNILRDETKPKTTIDLEVVYPNVKNGFVYPNVEKKKPTTDQNLDNLKVKTSKQSEQIVDLNLENDRLKAKNFTLKEANNNLQTSKYNFELPVPENIDLYKTIEKLNAKNAKLQEQLKLAKRESVLCDRRLEQEYNKGMNEALTIGVDIFE